MMKITMVALVGLLMASVTLAIDDEASKAPMDDLCRYTANCDYEIRDKLLSIPVWNVEAARASRIIVNGEVRIEKRGYKLFALFDTGMNCEAEVTFVPGGFMADCTDPFSKKYVQVDDAYQAVFGSYILTLRPRR